MLVDTHYADFLYLLFLAFLRVFSRPLLRNLGEAGNILRSVASPAEPGRQTTFNEFWDESLKECFW